MDRFQYHGGGGGGGGMQGSNMVNRPYQVGTDRKHCNVLIKRCPHIQTVAVPPEMLKVIDTALE